MRFFYTVVVALLACTVLSPPVWADTVRLNNGDQLSGVIRSEDSETVTLEHVWLGTLLIKRTSITEIVREPSTAPAHSPLEPKEPEVDWMRKITLGYDLTSGNTIKEGLAFQVMANHKTHKNDLTLQADGHYASTNQQMDTQRYSGSARYAYSFGQDLKWYNFYKLEGEHDRFSNVDLRLLPSLGAGYWFSDTEDWKAMTELGAGWERTKFRDGTSERSDMVIVPRAFAQKRIFGDAMLSEDFTIWSNLSETGEFRLRSETKLTNPLSEKLAMEVAFIDEFDSNPGSAVKKNDARLTSSLVYTF